MGCGSRSHENRAPPIRRTGADGRIGLGRAARLVRRWDPAASLRASGADRVLSGTAAEVARVGRNASGTVAWLTSRPGLVLTLTLAAAAGSRGGFSAMRGKGSFNGRTGLVLSLAVAWLVSCEHTVTPGKREPAQAPTAPSTVQAAEPSGERPAQERNVFQSPLAGSWYEADAERLRKQIDRFLANAAGEKLTHVCALILPHAGYRWSGQTAAYGVRQLQGRRFRRVIVIGPSHR
ncbi:MAG TPA: AmmeMemoRadiSam system protein B, partial [Planctomycetaceae bacterium]|nr:AmmeMemoRadiSam system protein B [Planctomycetaceae bacterium]